MKSLIEKINKSQENRSTGNTGGFTPEEIKLIIYIYSEKL